jgi:mono/diheme cytochrome c family protein
MHCLRLLIPAVALALTFAPRSAPAQSATPPGASPVTAAARQLDLGEQWFKSACLECHAVRGLDNADFRLKWDGRNAFDLFERIRSTMPESRPGTLTQGTYASIVAYLMKLNGMKVGTTVVPSDSAALAAIRLRFAAAAAVPRP